jgi:23S rRNA pseudouridine1911/1915/1917 synthase
MAFRVVKYFRSFASFIEVCFFSILLLPSHFQIDLETGFVHQIRASMRHIGHPVLGDKVYSSEESNALSHRFGVKRQLLHAALLDLPACELNVESPLCEDFAQAMTKLDENRS